MKICWQFPWNRVDPGERSEELNYNRMYIKNHLEVDCGRQHVMRSQDLCPWQVVPTEVASWRRQESTACNNRLVRWSEVTARKTERPRVMTQEERFTIHPMLYCGRAKEGHVDVVNVLLENGADAE